MDYARRMQDELIFKIMSRDQWQAAHSEGIFRGAPIDLKDGYIHFSTAEQAVETAVRHFAGQADLLLAAVKTEALGDKLAYEVSRGGALFPHLYSPLQLSAVVWVKPLPLDADGHHVFPDMKG